LPGGYGIMLDDAVAGLFAVVCLAAGRALWL
jgi:Phosphatidylglycerophosphatase A.